MVGFSSKDFIVTHFTSVNFKTKSLHKNHVNSLHITSLHFTSLHFTSLIYTQSPLVTTFLTFFLNVFIFQRKEDSKTAGNWFQLSMVVFTKEYLPTSVHCFLFLIFRL